jgi:hypothetical protein
MGVRYSIEANTSLYVVVDDCVDLYQAIFTGSLVDETSGLPIVSMPAMSIDVPGISLRSTEDALIAGAAVVANVFPDAATKAYNFKLAVSAPGYRSATVPVAIPAGSTFPIFVPPVVMRRVPLRLQGRVVKASDRSAITTAVVSSKDAKHLLLRDALRLGHAAGTSVNSVSLSNAGAPRSLAEAVLAGSNTLALSTNAGLAAGDLLQLGSAVSAGIYPVASVGPGPALVTLSQKLGTSAVTSTVVQGLTASAPAGTSTLARSADAGDGVVSLATALSGQALQIFDGASTEYHRLNALSDANGYYRVNGITGLQTLELLCSAPAFTTLDQPWTPDYSQPVTILDLLLRP